MQSPRPGELLELQPWLPPRLQQGQWERRQRQRSN